MIRVLPSGNLTYVSLPEGIHLGMSQKPGTLVFHPTNSWEDLHPPKHAI